MEEIQNPKLDQDSRLNLELWFQHLGFEFIEIVTENSVLCLPAGRQGRG
jgi:hypothetical protein